LRAARPWIARGALIALRATRPGRASGPRGSLRTGGAGIAGRALDACGGTRRTGRTARPRWTGRTGDSAATIRAP
jgi:hypothetical protein